MNYELNTIILRHIPGSCPLRSEVTYIESEYTPAVNDFIIQYYDSLQRDFVMCDLTLNYLPVVYNQLSSSRSIRYYQPATESNMVERLAALTTADYTSLLALTGQHIQPMLVRFIRTEGPLDVYESVQLNPDGDLSSQFHDFLLRNEPKPLHSICYRFPSFRPDIPSKSSHDIAFENALCEVESEQLFDTIESAIDAPDSSPIASNIVGNADDQWDEDMQRALDEARWSVSRLLQYGIRETILRNLLFPEAKPSRLIVRYDYTFYLPEYNIEIELRPIERAVYVLFLSHPEGIDFKSLPDYRRELGLVYDTIAQRTNTRFSASVLDRITNPFDNSINEKCSRIKKAFLHHFDDQKASLYYISGPQGGLKSIPLTANPDMIVWE